MMKVRHWNHLTHRPWVDKNPVRKLHTGSSTKATQLTSRLSGTQDQSLQTDAERVATPNKNGQILLFS